MLRFFPFLLSLATGHAAVVASLTTNVSTWTKDPSFGVATDSPVIVIEQGTDADGYRFHSDHSTVSYANSTTTDNGARSVTGTETFSGYHRQLTEESADSLTFHSETRLAASLSAQIAHAPIGNFFFVTVAENKSSTEFRRVAAIRVDQPLRLTLHCSFSPGMPAGFSSFRDVFSSLTLIRPGLSLQGIMYSFSTSNYIAGQTTQLSASSTKQGVNYDVHGIADDQGIEVVIDLSPEISGSAVDLEFRWLLRPSLNLSVVTAMPFTSRNLSIATGFEEAFQVRAIPEPRAAGLLAAGALVFARRRRG